MILREYKRYKYKIKIVFLCVYGYIVYECKLYVHSIFVYYMYILHTCKWEINFTYI